MRFEKVDLNLFVVLDTIYVERSLTRSAEVLHVTQPAISNALKRLREAFNDQLFVRTPEGMLPTPVTENVIGRARQALQLFRSCLNEYDSFDANNSEKTYQIAMSDMAEVLFLPNLSKKLQTLAPNIKLRSLILPRQEVPTALANNSIDLAIEPQLLSSNQLISELLLEDDHVCVMRNGHPFARKKLTLDSYLSLPHLHLSSRRRGIGLVDIALKGLDKKRNIALRSQYYTAAEPIITNTDMLLSIPKSLANTMNLTVHALPFEVQPLRIHLFWHKNADNNQANQWFREKIIKLYNHSS